MGPTLRVLDGGAVPETQVTSDPWEFQAACVEASVASWRARGFSPVTIGNDIGLLERALKALGRFLFLRVLAPWGGLSPTGIATIVRGRL